MISGANRAARSPASAGYAMPAEWEPHAATWVAWPHNRSDWPGKFGPIPWVYAEIIGLLRQRELVRVLVQDAAEERRVRRILARHGPDPKAAAENVEFFRVPTDRVWTRDTGPLVVRRASGDRLAVHFHFNGWAKYSDWRRDAKVGERIARVCGIERFCPMVRERRVVLEGGAIDVDGQGTLLATEECLLSDVQARNPALPRAEIERVLADALGIRSVVWLGQGVAGDDTHGHIDDVARFVGPGRIVLALETRPSDINYRPLQENRERLETARTASGHRLEVTALPMPAPRIFEGRRLPASYANFYVANGLVLVPTFNDPHDRLALGILADLFPERQVVGVYAGDLVWGLGTLHCMTMQEPAPG